MKKIIAFVVFTFLFFIPQDASAQKLDCKKFKNGTFKLVDKSTGTTFIIKRKGAIQTEEIEGESRSLSFTIKWIDDCKYTVLATQETLDYDKRYAGVLVIEIIEVKDKSYIMRATMPQHPDFVLESEMFLME